MKELSNDYVKRTQKDYSISFKVSVVREIESGSLSVSAARRKYGIQGGDTVRQWRMKYGIFDTDNSPQSKAMQSPEQKIKELEQKIRQLERKNHFLEECLTESEDKAAILDKLIELAEKEYVIPIRKNSSPDQSSISTKKTKKR